MLVNRSPGPRMMMSASAMASSTGGINGDGVTVMGNQVDIPDGFALVAPGGVDGAFTVNPAAVGQFRHQGGPVDGDRQDFTLGIQDFGQGLYAGGKAAGVAGQHGQEHVAGIVPLEAPVFVEPLSERWPGRFPGGGTGPGCT
jgi:hypothetical protein